MSTKTLDSEDLMTGIAALCIAGMFVMHHWESSDAPTEPDVQAPDTNEEYEDYGLELQRSAALGAIQSETKVQSAEWGGSFLYVLVYDDGTRRNGLAEYFCQVLGEHDAAESNYVVIRNAAAWGRNQDIVELGRARCGR